MVDNKNKIKRYFLVAITLTMQSSQCSKLLPKQYIYPRRRSSNALKAAMDMPSG